LLRHVLIAKADHMTSVRLSPWRWCTNENNIWIYRAKFDKCLMELFF